MRNWGFGPVPGQGLPSAKVGRVRQPAAMVGHGVSASREMFLRDVKVVVGLGDCQRPIDVPAESIGTGELVRPRNAGSIVAHEADVGIGIGG